MAQLSAEARTHNLEAELLKMEKGACVLIFGRNIAHQNARRLGKKWSRKLVVVDGENKTIRYHRPKDDKRSAPRKIFRLSELLLDANVQGPKRAPKAFELRHRVNGYSIVLACERGAAEHRAWCNVLAPLAHAAVSLPPAPGPPPSPRIADDDDEAEARDDSEALTLLAEHFPQASSDVIQSEYALAGNDVELAMQSLHQRFNNNALPSATTADEDALATLVRLFPNMPENEVRAELEKAGGTLEAATEALLARRSAAIRLQQQQQEHQPRFDAIFEQGQPLGLQLRLAPADDAGVRHVVVLAVKPTCPAAHILREGDKLVASNGIDIPEARTKQQFGELTKSLARAPRPLVLTFKRLAEESNVAKQPMQADRDESEGPSDITLPPGMRPPHDFKDERPTDYEVPARRARQQHQRFEVSFDTFPLGFKLVLTQYPHGRLAIQLNDVSATCARFEQLQVLDELVSINGSSDFAEPEVTPGSFELATQTLSAAVRSQAKPLRLGFARMPAIFSIDFPRKPLGLILRLTTIDDRKAVIVKDVQNTGSEAASSLQAGDDQLIAVHGKLLPHHCESSEFEHLMFELKESKHWPLRLTFWRHSLETEDEQIFSSSPTSDEQTRDPPPSLGPSLPSLESISDEEVNGARATNAESPKEVKLIEETVCVRPSEDLEIEAEEEATPVETCEPVAKANLGEYAKKAEEQNSVEATESPVVNLAEDAKLQEMADAAEAAGPAEKNEPAEQPAVITLTQDAPEHDIIEKVSAKAFVEAAYLPCSHKPSHVENCNPAELPEEPREPVVSTKATAYELDDLTSLSEPHFSEDKSVLASAAVVAMERIPALMTFTPSRQIRKGGPLISSDPQMFFKENDAKPASTEAVENPLVLEKEGAVSPEAGRPPRADGPLVDDCKHILEENKATVLGSLELPPDACTSEAEDPGRPNTAPARMTTRLAEFLETGRLPVAMAALPSDEWPRRANEQTLGPGEAERMRRTEETVVTTPTREQTDARINEEEDVSTCLASRAGSVTSDASQRQTNRRTSKGSHVEAMKRQLEQRIEAQHPAYKKPEISSVTKNEAQELVESLVTEQDSFGVESTKQQLAQSAISRPSPARGLSEEELPARGTTPRLSAIFGQSKMPARSISSAVVEDDEESDFDGTHDSDIGANDRGSGSLPNAASTTPSECSKYKMRDATADLLVEATRQLDDDGHDDLVGFQRKDADRRHAILLEEQLETLRKELERKSSELVQAKEALTRETALAEDRVGAAEAAAAALIELARLELGEAQREAKRRFDLLDEAIRRATPGYVPGDKADIVKLREELAIARRDAEVARLELEAAKCRELEAIEIARRDVDSAKRQLRSKEGDTLPDDGELDETAERRENEELQDALRHLEQLGAAVPDDEEDEACGVDGNAHWVKREDADTISEPFRLPLTQEHTNDDDYVAVANLGTNAKREVHLIAVEQLFADRQSAAADQKSKDGPSSDVEKLSEDREHTFMKSDQDRDDNELDAKVPIEACANKDLTATAHRSADGELPREEDGIEPFVPDLQLDDDDDMEAALELEEASKREEQTIAAELVRDAAEEQAQDRELIFIEAERHRREAELEADLALEALAHEDREQMEAAAALEEARWECALSSQNEGAVLRKMEPDCRYPAEAYNVGRNEECKDNIEHYKETESARNFYEQDDWLDEAKKQQQDHERDEMLYGAASFDASYHYDHPRQSESDFPVLDPQYCNSEPMHAAQYPAFDCSPTAQMSEIAHAQPAFSSKLATEPIHESMHPNSGSTELANGDDTGEPGRQLVEGVDDLHDAREEEDSFEGDFEEDGAVLMLHLDDDQRRDVELQRANDTEELYTSEAEQPDSTSLLDNELAGRAATPLKNQRLINFTNDDDLHHMSEQTRQAIKVATREAFEEERRAAQAELAAARERELEKIHLAKDELQRELEYVRHQARVELDAELEHEKAAIEAAKQRELESVRRAREEIEEATRREIAEIKERARRTLDEATRLELEEVRKAAEEVRALELARVQQSRDEIQAAAREQLDEIELTRGRLRTREKACDKVTGVTRDEECDSLAAAYFQHGLSGIELARTCLSSGLSPPPTCRELIKACLRQLAAVDRHTEVHWCERRHVGAALRALASVDDDALCVGDDGGWVAALDELVAYCDEVLNFGAASNATPQLVIYFATLLEQGVVPREAFEAWRGRNAAALADSQHGNQRRRPAIALRQTDSWFASTTTSYEERSSSQSCAVTTRNRSVVPSRLSTRDLASPTAPGPGDEEKGVSKRFPPTAAEVEVALSFVAGDNDVGNTDTSQCALLEKIREEGPRGARVMAAALAAINDDEGSFEALVSRSSLALRTMLQADISEQAALIAVVAEYAGAELSDRLEVLHDAGVVDEAGLRAWHAFCSVDAQCARDGQRQAEARAALLAAEPFFANHHIAAGSANSAKLEERLAAERSRLDAELARRLLDERSFFEKRLEQLSPARPPLCNADPDSDQPPSGTAVVRDLSSSFAAQATAKPLALHHDIPRQDDNLPREGLATGAVLEERIARAEERFAASSATLPAAAESETLARVNAPSQDGPNKATEITESRSQGVGIPSGRLPPMGLPQSVQPLLRERFLALLCKPCGPLLDDEACPLRVSIEHSYNGAIGWCVVEIANASVDEVLALKVDVFSDDERFMASPLARRRRDVSSEQRPTPRLSVAFDNEDRSVRGGGCISLQPGAETTRRLAAECRAPFVVPPELTLRFEMAGKRYAYALRLPIAPPAFAAPDEGCAMDLTLFRSRWDAIGSATEQQIVVSSKTPINDSVLDDLKYRVVCRACRAALVKGADATKFTVTAATAICCSSPSPRVIVLIRLEINVPAHAYRITVRSPSADASAAFKNVIQALITSYFIM